MLKTDTKYRIVQCDYSDGTVFEVQKEIWRQVPGNHKYGSVEEAKKRISYLKTVPQRRQNVVYEDWYWDI